MVTPPSCSVANRSWSRLSVRSGALTLGVALLLPACSEEFAPPVESCAPPTCEGQPGTCFAQAFAGPVCPSDWHFSGDPLTDVLAECTDGKLHIVASGTLDLTASYSLPTPMEAYSIRIAARMAVTLWDYGTLLTVAIGGVPAFFINASANQTSPVTFSLCSTPNDCSATFEAVRGEEHLFQFEITDTGTAVTIDCAPWGHTPSVELVRDSSMSVDFGHWQADPIDGTLDDVVVAFP
jgi:hypothetical protein